MSAKHITVLFVFIVLTATCGTASAWLSGYDHRMAITVNNGEASPLSYYQFNFTNDTNTLVAAGHIQASGADCRVTDSSDNLIPFWNETSFNAAGTKVWANATTLAVGDNTFYMYYGDAAASPVADGDATFDFFDDFEMGDERYFASRAAGSSIGFNAVCPRVVVADDGTWLMVYRAKADGSPPSGHSGQVWIRSSTDVGETWSAGTKLSNDVIDALNAEFIKYPNGDIEIFYNSFEDGAPKPYADARTMSSKSIDDGATWSAFVERQNEFDGDLQVMWQEHIIGSVVYLAVGADYIDENDNYIYSEMYFYKSSNDGISWAKVGNITTYAADGTYYENGIVYVGGTTFVSVLRDHGKSHTLQKRSTDMGVTWITDGYIKSDGSVAASGVGTDVVLHQCRLWSEDIAGNSLGYIYMQANLYPGSYPRDMYAYISTDDCASWETVDPIYTAPDGHDSAIVFKTNTSAKYYPGKQSGESATTADNITISLAEIPSTSKWDLTVSCVELSTDHVFKGTKSVKFTSTGSMQKTLAHSDNIAIKTWMYFPDQTDGMFPFLHGDSVSKLYARTGCPTAGDISYHDGGWQDTGVNIITGAWAPFETQDFNWAAHTQDILYNDAVIANDVGQRSGDDYDDAIQISSGGGTCYVDCYLVRKYTSPEPTSSLGTEENAPSGLQLTTSANEYFMFNDWEVDRTFSQIAALNPNDVCYSWYDHSTGMHEAYYVGRTYNAAKSISADCSVLGFFDTEIIIGVTERASITIPNNCWYYGLLPGSSPMTIANIKTSMNTDSLDCWAVYRWTGSAWAASGTVEPKQGIITYNNNTGSWTP